eukprot:maker-scaffold1298_size49789-snap-gene-0.9 protein:Tk10578 transcript:maker-scaffold1298_size49789-snap-gene-0.9-mRNA-1 annotation:"PREDICTED: leupaxin-like"
MESDLDKSQFSHEFMKPAMSELDSLLHDLDVTCSQSVPSPSAESSHGVSMASVSEERPWTARRGDSLTSSAVEETRIIAQSKVMGTATSIRDDQDFEGKWPSLHETDRPSENTDNWEYVGFGVWDSTKPKNQFHTGPEDVSEQLPDRAPRPNPRHYSKSLQSSGKRDEGRGELAKPFEDLDNLLTNLCTDMSKQGITSSFKGQCNDCGQPILGKVVTALGKLWHPEHFVCFQCKEELGGRIFFEKDGHAFCEEDYNQTFSPLCGKCSEPIQDRCVTAVDKTWHPDCFACVECHKAFNEDCYLEKDGEPYCQNCFQDKYYPKCGACGLAISNNYVSHHDTPWHMKCLVCSKCGTYLENMQIFEDNGDLFCETHYHAVRGSLCANCQKVISGKCITALSKKYHPEHFVCSFCLKQLNRGTFKEKESKPYCHECFSRLFA